LKIRCPFCPFCLDLPTETKNAEPTPSQGQPPILGCAERNERKDIRPARLIVASRVLTYSVCPSCWTLKRAVYPTLAPTDLPTSPRHNRKYGGQNHCRNPSGAHSRARKSGLLQIDCPVLESEHRLKGAPVGVLCILETPRPIPPK
jgi:hypothetical protein